MLACLRVEHGAAHRSQLLAASSPVWVAPRGVTPRHAPARAGTYFPSSVLRHAAVRRHVSRWLQPALDPLVRSTSRATSPVPVPVPAAVAGSPADARPALPVAGGLRLSGAQLGGLLALLDDLEVADTDPVQLAAIWQTFVATGHALALPWPEAVVPVIDDAALTSATAWAAALEPVAAQARQWLATAIGPIFNLNTWVARLVEEAK